MKITPAFPIPEGCLYDGMSLRDYFAAKAMAALIQSGQCRNLASGNLVLSSLAGEAYDIAEAMILEKEHHRT
jgi:hypothetical protein